MQANRESGESGLLAGRSVVVAGGTGNVGRYLTRGMLDLGATVLVTSRSAERLENLRATLADDPIGDRLIGLEADLGDARGAEALDAALESRGIGVHAAVASLGRFIAAPSVLDAPTEDLRAVLGDYVTAHLSAARALIPRIEPGGSYTFVNGPLAFDPRFDGAGLVSIATAGQAMLARVLMKELADRPVRVNEVVLYTPFGWGDDGPVRAALAPEEVGRYVALLSSPAAATIDGRTIHLNSRQPLEALEAEERDPTGTGPAPT